MYELLLTVIIVILILVAAYISNKSNQPPILTSDVLLYTDTQFLRQQALIPFENKLIPDIPHGSNPLGMYNMSVRKTESGYSGLIRGTSCDGCRESNPPPLFSYVYQISLDNNVDILGIKLIDFDYRSINRCNNILDVHANGIEDAKLFIYQGEEWGIGNILGSNSQPHPCINAMCIFKLSDPKGTFRILSTPPNINPKQRQKNWAPFEWKGKLLCEYSINPHRILEINPETGNTTDFAISGKTSVDVTSTLSRRTGPAPILISNNEVSYYLGVGHVRSHGIPDYTHFFYVFEADPPFRIIGITDLYKLDVRTRIQFVAGLSEYVGNIYISYGISDCENRISIFEISRILDLLKPVSE